MGIKISFIVIVLVLISIRFYTNFKRNKNAFFRNFLILFFLSFLAWMYDSNSDYFSRYLLFFLLPLGTVNLIFFAYFHQEEKKMSDKKYQANMQLEQGKLVLENIQRGISVIGSAGSGKTESVIYNLMQHVSHYCFCGIIHDYKDFELTEIAYPLFKKNKKVSFHTISFDPIYAKVNPIAPRYVTNEEDVNEIAKVLLENLLEFKDGNPGGSTKFFSDAVEGLLGGMIWKLKTKFPNFCTLPHLIAIYQYLDTKALVAFLSSNTISKSMASAFINGIASDRQTAAVKSTLANALKKISTQKIFMVLSEDEVPLDCNNSKNPSVISIVNNPKYETAYAPVIATIMHTVVKQMSVRDRRSSFILLEEAPTIRLLNMHRIPATLRSYDIATIYVMQDKIQNDLLYGEKASRAILSNLSYQFFGKVNDPDTAKYYERFFEIIRKETTSVSRGHNLDFDTRITKGEREVSKIRADVFFRLQPGEFISFADGKDKKIQFELQTIQKELPEREKKYTEMDLRMNFERIHREAKSIFQKK